MGTVELRTAPDFRAPTSDVVMTIRTGLIRAVRHAVAAKSVVVSWDRTLLFPRRS